MLVRLEIELLEPIVLARVTPKHVNFMLSKALSRYSRKTGSKISLSLDFEPIEGETRTIKAREFPSNRKKTVKAIRRGIVELKARLDNPQALLYINDPSGPLRYFRKACHDTKLFLKRLARENHIRNYMIPCELTNFALGLYIPPRFLGRPNDSIRLWRDDRGFRHVFGLARIAITLRIISLEDSSWNLRCRWIQ